MKNEKLTAQIAPEQLERIYAAYLGCKYLTSGEEPDIFPIIGETITAIERYPKTFEGDRLILKPLSSISDEDASKCASMCGLHTAGNRVIRMEDAVFVDNDTYTLQISHRGYICLRKNGSLYNADMRGIYAFLMKEKYDCGYADIPSLIEAGIAIADTKNKTEL